MAPPSARAGGQEEERGAARVVRIKKVRLDTRHKALQRQLRAPLTLKTADV